MRWERECHVSDSSAVVSVRPHVVNGVLPSRTDRPALCQVEEHRGFGILAVENHEHNTVAGVSRPIFSWVRAVRGIVRVDTPSEWRYACADVWILVDLDQILVPEDLDGLGRCIGQISANDQWRLRQSPSGEVTFRFLVCEITRWRSLTCIADLHDVLEGMSASEDDGSLCNTGHTMSLWP